MAQPGNDLELITQVDGASVGVKEAKEYVSGKLKANAAITGVNIAAGDPVQINALDFTKGGDETEVRIIINGNTTIKVKKNLLEPTELFETGVYNSEMDVNSNPKTAENTPDKVGAVVDRLTERIKEITSTLDELVLFVKDNSSLSHESLDKCINELSSYVKALEDETNDGASVIINK